MKKSIDIKQVAEKLKGVETLVENNLLKFNLNNNKILMYTALLEGKSKKFKTNYIKSLFLYCGVKKTKEYDDSKTIQIIDIESDHVIGSFLKDKVSLS